MQLPSVVSERLVGFCHLVRILALLERAAGAVGGVEDLTGESFLHGLLASGSGVGRDPAQTQCLASCGANLHRNLIGGAADTASLYLENRHDIFHGLLKNLKRVVTCLFSNDIKCAVDDLLGNALLAVLHDVVDETGHEF